MINRTDIDDMIGGTDIDDAVRVLDRRLRNRRIAWADYVAGQREIYRRARDAGRQDVMDSLEFWASELDAESPELPSVLAHLTYVVRLDKVEFPEGVSA